MSMSSSRPYLIRALYQWIVDNDCTPYLLVNALADGVEVPQEHVKDGQIILNISPLAVQHINLVNESIDFKGRFAGIPKHVLVPMPAIMGIYARENGQGMIFEPEPDPPEPPDTGGRTDSNSPAHPGSDSAVVGRKRGRKTRLRLVK